jgi:hypothetical protein
MGFEDGGFTVPLVALGAGTGVLPVGREEIGRLALMEGMAGEA